MTLAHSGAAPLHTHRKADPPVLTTRDLLFRVNDLAAAAGHNAILSASFDRVRPDRADHFATYAEEALTEALDLLRKAKGQAMSRPVEEAA